MIHISKNIIIVNKRLKKLNKCAITRVCHLKGKKAGTNRPAFIDK